MRLSVSIVLVLFGCAQAPWSKPGAAPEQIVADQKRCEYEARAATDDTKVTVERAMMREIQLERLCMESRGYSRAR